MEFEAIFNCNLYVTISLCDVSPTKKDLLKNLPLIHRYGTKNLFDSDLSYPASNFYHHSLVCTQGKLVIYLNSKYLSKLITNLIFPFYVLCIFKSTKVTKMGRKIKNRFHPSSFQIFHILLLFMPFSTSLAFFLFTICKAKKN